MEDIFNTQSELQEELTDTQVSEVDTEEIDDLPADDAVLPTENPAEEEESVEDTEESSENEIVSEEKPKKEDKLNYNEQRILAEMERRVNEDNDTLLADAMQSKDKNIHDCYAYVWAKARNQAVKVQGGMGAMIDDAVVFGWAHHYYIEPKAVIDAELHPKPKDKPKTDTPKKPEKKPVSKPKNPKEVGNTNPIFKVVGKGKKNPKQGNDKVYTKKVGDKTFTITEFALF